MTNQLNQQTQQDDSIRAAAHAVQRRKHSSNTGISLQLKDQRVGGGVSSGGGVSAESGESSGLLQRILQLKQYPTAAAQLQTDLLQRQPNKTGLPDNLKSGMESLSGMSLDHVRVHYNSSKPAAVQAHAYAQGSDIHLASGQERHLPHELGHVVQQAQGRVQATTTVGGMAVNDNPGLENEATAMGNKALSLGG
ncbi:eCIS core domain-containing protein [Oceanospirillum sediminis]|uniref:eCIS core domain-containing protein n=1 Tax=Oceanospirillum sediminis TaxID=2760088 RepID=UPI001C72160A|nr:DUF4157 domain-containing protein [Oceanospirillum sediminis]